ncbi:MAG: GLPGLI family protein [Bacteroidetes bacterium]|nr:GLPGLI family protein [Bacteroidota bacterium]
MKQLFFTLFFLVFSLEFGLSQTIIAVGTMPGQNQKPPKILDNTMLQITYEVRSVRDSLELDQFVEDVMVLQIGKQGISKYYNDTNRRRDSIIRAMNPQLSAPPAGGNATYRINPQQMQLPRSSGDQTTVFKNWPTGSLTVTDQVMMNAYSYTESPNQMEWKILPDTDTLLSYFCQKAVTEFRGRKFEAWFTPEIPLNEGPWKFCGLPGLILQVSDTRQHYLFQCTGLVQVDGPIEFAELDYLKTNRRDLARVKRKFYEDPRAALEAMSNSMGAGGQTAIRIRTADGSTSDTGRPISIKYNPIELDY